MATMQNNPGEAGRPSPVVSLREMITGMRVTQLIYVAAKLGIADLLRDGSKSIDELASKVGAHPLALYRVLRALASLGIFAEVGNRQFELTALAGPLRDQVPGSLRAVAIMNGDEWRWKPWGDLLNCVKTGDTPFHRVLGMSQWEYLTKNAEAGTIFNKMMSGSTERTAKAVVEAEAYDFSGVNRVVDLAGGHGALIAAILKRYPDVQGVLFDLPHVAEQARKRLTDAGLAKRCEVIGGDIFASVPQGGTVYILSQVVHDWDDDRAIAILKNCYRGMKDKAKLLLVEKILPAHADQSVAVLMLDVHMMVTTGGRERTETEYRALLDAAGFRVTNVIPTQSPMSVVECVPV